MDVYSDLWSFGCFALELIAGYPPVMITGEEQRERNNESAAMNALHLARVHELLDLGVPKWYRYALERTVSRFVCPLIVRLR